MGTDLGAEEFLCLPGPLCIGKWRATAVDAHSCYLLGPELWRAGNPPSDLMLCHSSGESRSQSTASSVPLRTLSSGGSSMGAVERHPAALLFRKRKK
ncbi:hypothetical protein NDU88_000768 [Pleurodeles waltl]|uniref:Uncharacterized protein n=1 Tax=Pleurodeles waltl TaxID=8319 RepID=A0AAV7MJ15_PLEWA|nr:hypothetical protein NDU88_000768 [Pleurodeles waltl]